jgi:hypothetical protein
MEYCWNETDGVKFKYLEINLNKWPFLHNNSHMECSEIKPGSPLCEVGD